MRLPIYQIDAFASKTFEGNPAAVCPLEAWIETELMQAIAAENNLAETAFFVREGDAYAIRWFTPTTEVDLCGHATLAAAFVLFEYYNVEQTTVTFTSRSGELFVSRQQRWLSLDFPLSVSTRCELPQAIIDAFKPAPIACYKAEDYIVIFEHEDDILRASPNFEALKALDLRGVAITAQSQTFDFVTRFFAPNFGINEDPVTGSAFTQLAPYWAAQLGKTELVAKQLSQRGGVVRCNIKNNRLIITGEAVCYLKGEIQI